MDNKTVLHVGCGGKNPELVHPFFRGEEWQEIRLDIDPRVKPDIVGSMTDMKDVDDASVDAVWSSHNLEHLHAHEVPQALKEFHRVLNPDGFALINVPDLLAAAEEIVKGNLEGFLYRSPAGVISPIDLLYGMRAAVADVGEPMAHRTGFTAEALTHKLQEAGFLTVRTTREQFGIWAIAGKKESQFQGPTI